jgi:hypothetical protein
LAHQYTQLDLGHIQATALLVRVMQLQSIPNPFGFGWRKRAVERGWRVPSADERFHLVTFVHAEANHMFLSIGSLLLFCSIVRR